MRTIILQLVLLLFAVLQGTSYAQTEQDTLKRELNEIAAKQKKLQSQMRKLQMQQSELQRVEHIIVSYQSSNTLMELSDVKLIMKTLPTPPEYEMIVWREGLDLQRQAGELNIRKMELQRQVSEINIQIEALHRRENEIKKQQETQQRQQKIAQR